MEFKDVVLKIADSLKEFDNENPVFKSFNPGIGPFGEPQIVKEIASRLTKAGIPSETKRNPDLLLKNDWAIEIKIIRPFGDNGLLAENWSVNLLHPYPGNTSLLGDAIKLINLDTTLKKGLLAIAYEHNPFKVDLDPLLKSFELIASQVLQISLGNRIQETRNNLIHKEHQTLRCLGWELLS